MPYSCSLYISARQRPSADTQLQCAVGAIAMMFFNRGDNHLLFVALDLFFQAGFPLSE